MRVLLLAVFLAFLAAFANQSAAVADSAGEPKLELLPPNPKYVEYWEKVRAGERPSGLTPSPVDWSILKKEGAARRRARAAVDLPLSYDLVAEGVTPPVLNQRNWGTCWSFATIEAIEAGVKSADKTNGTENYVELSELHLAYYAFMDEGPDKPSFTKDLSPVREDGVTPRNVIFDNGGLVDITIALLSRGTGPLAEEDAPYPDNLPDDLGAWAAYVPPAPPKGPAQFRLKNAYYFWNDRDDLKAALMKHGAMAFAYGNYRNYNYNTVSGDSISTPDARNVTHEVLLVGWDDNYPKEAFGPYQPEDNGAWKIQNSWGTDAGTDGFYWISYEDATIFGAGNGNPNALPAAFEMMPADSYDDDGIYFHDPLGSSAFISATDAAYDSFTAANVFTARRDEKIAYVGFMTGQDEQDCEIQVYRDIPDEGSPGEGNAVFDAPLPCRVTDGGGYASVKLDDPVQIRKGERFAVTVTFKRPDGDSRVAAPIEERLPGEYAKASMNPRESYYLWGNEWRDIYYETDPKGNFCVKAFTVPSPAPDDGGGSSGGCDSVSAGLLVFAGLALLMLRRKAVYMR
jgi:C1A family cysteine protease